MLNPEYLKPLWFEREGRFLIALAVTLQILGYWPSGRSSGSRSEKEEALILIVAVSVFLATVIVTIGLYWAWRPEGVVGFTLQESSARRICRKRTRNPRGNGSAGSGAGCKKTAAESELLERLSGKELEAPALLNQAGYRSAGRTKRTRGPLGIAASSFRSAGRRKITG